MRIKTILFDLDGVIVDTKWIHFQTLNKALEHYGESYKITWEEHLNTYDGLKTRSKLEILSKEKGLPLAYHDDIWKRKQDMTTEYMKEFPVETELCRLLSNLSSDGYKMGICSNSIRQTVMLVLSKLDIIEYFDIVVSNGDVKHGKPHPEMYWKAMVHLDSLPEETLILEDSPHGLLAASRSHAHVLRISKVLDTNYTNIMTKIQSIERLPMPLPKWSFPKLNVLIPMAGAGSRFEKAGYVLPKPMIDVKGRHMIQVVVENLNLEAHFIYVVQQSHRKQYNLDAVLNLMTPGCKIVEVDGLTEGAACTALLAKEMIDNDSPLFFANSDQFVEWNSSEFMYKMQETNVDGGIAVFEAHDPKWSYAKTDATGRVVEVAEKNPISSLATVGYYYWKRGRDFVKYASEMIAKNIRVNNEFYVCPVFNEAIQDGKHIHTFKVNKMWGLGTPEDLNFFLKHY